MEEVVLNSEDSLKGFLSKFGSGLKNLRKDKGLSQQELASTAGLDRAYISSVENGKQNVSIGAVAKLAHALGVSIDRLLTVRIEDQIEAK